MVCHQNLEYTNIYTRQILITMNMQHNITWKENWTGIKNLINKKAKSAENLGRENKLENNKNVPLSNSLTEDEGLEVMFQHGAQVFRCGSEIIWTTLSSALKTMQSNAYLNYFKSTWLKLQNILRITIGGQLTSENFYW